MTFTVSALTAICDDKPIISIFQIFLRKVIETSFNANLYLLLVVHVHMKLENNASE